MLHASAVPRVRAHAQVLRQVRGSAKPGIHPELHEAKIVLNGEEVGQITGTQTEYHVEVWSGNHPFYKGDTRALVLDEGQVNKFKARYAGLGALADVPTASDSMKEGKAAKQGDN